MNDVYIINSDVHIINYSNVNNCCACELGTIWKDTMYNIEKDEFMLMLMLSAAH